jgi:hypothetical protein
MQNQCTEDECERPMESRGLCGWHYRRYRKLGTLPPLRTPIERFMAKVEFTDTCWEWTARRDVLGYGQLLWNQRAGRAHRVAYEYFVGPIPDGLELDHLCRNPPCVNPDHLEAVTHRENVLRGESPSARHARKTHCPQGHDYTATRTGATKGKRYCQTCRRERQKLAQGA